MKLINNLDPYNEVKRQINPSSLLTYVNSVYPSMPSYGIHAIFISQPINVVLWKHTNATIDCVLNRLVQNHQRIFFHNLFENKKGNNVTTYFFMFALNL